MPATAWDESRLARRRLWTSARAALAEAERRLDYARNASERAAAEAWTDGALLITDALLDAEADVADRERDVARLRLATEGLRVGSGV